MDKLILRELTTEDESAFLSGHKLWQHEELSWYTFAWKAGMSHAEHLQKLQENKDETKLPAHFVPNTMLYGFVNGEIIGRISIRHKLNDNLLERGGHVGYAVSPAHRQKGYATEMLRQGLDFCRQLGLNKILITCNDSNIPSWKVIEKFSGVLENKILDDKNELIRRYWLTL